MQRDGVSYCARDVSYQLHDGMCYIDMDIAAAYPTETGLISYKRNAALVKGQEIVIKDIFLFHDGSMKENHNTADNINSVIMSLMTYEKPVIDKNASGRSDFAEPDEILTFRIHRHPARQRRQTFTDRDHPDHRCTASNRMGTRTLPDFARYCRNGTRNAHLITDNKQSQWFQYRNYMQWRQKFAA